LLQLIITPLEITRIIKEILAANDFVSLPEIGSFSQSYQPAKLSADGKTFSPPRQLIFFDSTRKFNDGAIENYLVKNQGITPAEAESATAKFIETIRLELENGLIIEFEGVGSLQKGSQGELVFKPTPLNEGATSTYGLGNIAIEPKPNQTKSPQSKQVIKSNTPKKKKRGVVYALLIVFVIIAASSLAIYLNPQLRFWQTKELAQSTRIEQDSTTNSTVCPAPNDSTGMKRDSAIQNTVQGQLSADKKRALYYEEPKKQDDRTYYIVAGSFSTQVNAQKFASTLVKKGFTPEIIQGNGNYRVSIASFSDKNRAFTELERYRKENPKEAYWVLGK
jgi:nucleoid DNA-binding protein